MPSSRLMQQFVQHPWQQSSEPSWSGPPSPNTVELADFASSRAFGAVPSHSSSSSLTLNDSALPPDYAPPSPLPPSQQAWGVPTSPFFAYRGGRQPPPRVSLTEALAQHRRAAQGPVVRYTSNVERVQDMWVRIEARKAQVRSVVRSLEDQHWGEHAPYTLLTRYLAHLDTGSSTMHSVRLAEGLHLSRHGFCLDVEEGIGAIDEACGLRAGAPDALCVPAAAAAGDASCLRLVQARGLVEVCRRDRLMALLESLPEELHVEAGRVHIPTSVPQMVAAAVQAVLCLPSSSGFDMPRGLLNDAHGAAEFAFWSEALRAEDGRWAHDGRWL